MKIGLLVVSSLLAVLPSFALADDAAQTMNVWPGKAPGDSSQIAKEDWQGKKVTNVTEPTLTIYRPAKDKDTGVAVIVCPGGGYKVLMMSYEGEDVAKWLTDIGITGIVLKYRVPAPPGIAKYLPGLQDAQRSVSLVRSRAKEWGINPDKVGILGFSAGGHLTAATCTNFEKRAYEPIDVTDQVSCRPDFGVAIYPGGVIEKGTSQMSPEITVTKQTPPMFIAQATDDPGSDNSVYLYLALKHAGVPAELHMYTKGGHGFGIKPTGKPSATWPDRCAEWMRSEGILKPADAK
ncbi:MAG TPA: alpha/beta hydrolase [Tepidisphaeraceae bacterium]|nr:alpha/beta hydrolase [Tepidisphaeraceae bacterium]